MGLLTLNLPVVGQASATEDQKVRDGLASIQTLLNGNVDEANVPNMAAAFTSYKHIATAVQILTPSQAAGTYLLTPHFWVNGNSPAAPGAATALTVDFGINLDPARYNANTRTTRLLLDVEACTNAVAPAITYTVGLYPVATRGGASGAAPFIATLGAVVTGSTAAVASPAASSRVTATSGDFTFPAAGQYVIAVATSGTPAAGTQTALNVNLEMRQV